LSSSLFFPEIIGSKGSSSLVLSFFSTKSSHCRLLRSQNPMGPNPYFINTIEKSADSWKENSFG